MLIDTHCHLNFKAFKKDLNNVIERARIAGIEKIIIPGARLDSSRKAIQIARDYDGIFAAVGIHPHHAADFRINPDQDFISLCRSKKVVAVGEIGLDKHHYQGYPPPSEENLKLQKKLLLFQLEMALSHNLPVILHCRDAYEELIETLTKFEKGKLRGVFHCFEGNSVVLEKVLKLGFFIGFDGNITYPENIHRIELIKKVPLNKLLLETDSPFLSPEYSRGRRNEPANLVHTARFLAGLYGTSPESLGEITSSNALNLFGLK